MKSGKVLLNETQKVNSFVSLAQKQMEDIDLASGRYIIDAKSLLGVFSLNLSRPVDIRVHSDDDSVLEKFRDYLA